MQRICLPIFPAYSRTRFHYSGVANLVTATVDGIITTGYQCGYRSTDRMWIRPDVPLLAIMGTADPYIRESLFFSRPSSLEQLCRTILTSPKWQAVIVPDMAHEASLDLVEVRDALGRFLDEIAPWPFDFRPETISVSQ